MVPTQALCLKQSKEGNAPWGSGWGRGFCAAVNPQALASHSKAFHASSLPALPVCAMGLLAKGKMSGRAIPVATPDRDRVCQLGLPSWAGCWLGFQG